MQLEEDPSISQVANRFMGTGLLSAPLPGKLKRPLRSAMVRAAGGTVRAPSCCCGCGEASAETHRRVPTSIYFPTLLFGSSCGRELTVLVPCERWGTSSFLLLLPPCRPSASQAEELQWGAAQGARVLGLLCTTTLPPCLPPCSSSYEERLVPHAQARRGAGGEAAAGQAASGKRSGEVLDKSR